MASKHSVNPLLVHVGRDVLTSAELIERLKKDGLTADNARQVLRRNSGNGEIWRSENLRLPNDERLFAARSLLQTSDFLSCAGAKIRMTSRHGLSRCLLELGKHLALHKVDVMRLLAVSDQPQSKSKRVYESELSALEELGLVRIRRKTPQEALVMPTLTGDQTGELANRATSVVRTESMLVRILAEQFRRQNFLSWNQVELPNADRPFTIFNGQVFSAFGFSYISPLARWQEGRKKPTPCPVLFDMYQHQIGLARVQSFIQRIERATHRGKSRLAVLGVIAARDFDEEAWAMARERGLATVNLRQTFGEIALDAMVQVETLLGRVSSAPTMSAEVSFIDFADEMNELKANPVVAMLRAIGFEALCGLVLRSTGCETVELGRVVPWNKTTRDVDVFGLKGDELVVLECKAYHRRKSLTPDDVRKFFTETVPALKKDLSARGVYFSRCTAQIWTTGPFGDSASDKLYSLRHIATDEWSVLRRSEIEKLIPTRIRERSVDLLNAIALDLDEENTNSGTA
jgi:hypothetical protein